jgi:phosphatidylglycerol:prolipoprotein diacylglycerol transferase
MSPYRAGAAYWVGADRGSDRALTDHATSFSMRPIPVAFHVWFLEVHTYGIGLALTFWFGLRYTERRLRKAGYPWQWVTGMFVWVIIAAIVGARALHVLSNLSYYSNHPSQIIAIWQGGLSSFGGLLFAVPVAIVSSRRRCPELPSLRFADFMAPVLMACWGIGRLLGPQMMVAGGGHPTNQWFGMYYAGQVGRRLPVPIFQSIEDFTIFGILLLVERWLRATAPVPALAVGAEDPPPVLLPPAGIVLGVGMVLWGIERFLDEHLWLGEDGHLGSLLVQWAGIGLAVTGIVLLATRIGPLRRWRLGEGGDPAPDGRSSHRPDPDSEPGSDTRHEPVRDQIADAPDTPAPAAVPVETLVEAHAAADRPVRPAPVPSIPPSAPASAPTSTRASAPSDGQ